MAMITLGPDGRPRCGWCSAAPEFFAYHDREWGFPVADDRRLFERCVFYDDLDANAYSTGVCVLYANAFERLWGICRSSGAPD